MPPPPAAVLRQFALSKAEARAETPLARVWSVRRANGAAAALKVYRAGHMGNEVTGVDYLRRCEGAPAVTLLEVSPDAIVMDWLEGPRLGDLARQGQAERADLALAQAARALLAKAVPATGLLPLQRLFRALETAQLRAPEARRAQAMAAECLSDLAQGRWPVVGLHGDLHHDNVIETAAGLRVIDAKGLAGPAAFELANAFRHPRDCAGFALQPEVISRRLTLWSRALDCVPEDLLRWAVAKVALSMVWVGAERDDDLAVLRGLLQAE